MNDLISRKELLQRTVYNPCHAPYITKQDVIECPTAEPKVAEWEDIEVFEVVGTTVDRLQSTFCPVCRRYHTTPYVYSYNHYDYCPNCGTQMKMKRSE